jgi:hypothetical protein
VITFSVYFIFVAFDAFDSFDAVDAAVVVDVDVDVDVVVVVVVLFFMIIYISSESEFVHCLRPSIDLRCIFDHLLDFSSCFPIVREILHRIFL